jgi:steroid delta-isomerase-like uncharacterized protein
MRTVIQSFTIILLTTALMALFITTGCQQQPPGAVTQQQAKAYGDTYLQATNEANLNLLDQIYSADLVAHFPNVPEAMMGLDALKEYYARTHTAYPDLKMTLDEPMVCGDKIIWLWTHTGTHTGPLGELPPTGNTVELSGVAICKMADGKVVEEWVFFDVLDMYTQLGFTLNPPPAPEK